MNKEIRKYSAGGVIYRNGKVLTIKWLSKDSIEFPKGTIEDGESPEQACIREVFEETGYKTRIIRPLTVSTFEYDWGDTKEHHVKTVHYYLLELINSDEPAPRREGHEDFDNLWLTPEEAFRQLTFSDAREVLEKVVASIE